MKKVININFQGRVIPIEETAYDILKQYLDSLRSYFSNEEGRDEIMNDIEGRIGELFSERLKSGITCITDADVNNIIAGMGRPEDFEAQGADVSSATEQQKTNQSYKYERTRRLYRNADDKIVAGVCSGLANYLGIDPIIARIAFILLSGALFWVYIILWIVVPSRSIQSNITKRLYRSADNKAIGGVAAGIAAYFNIDVWIPRLIFVLPFLLALISGGFHALWWNWDFGFMPRIISGSFGWTMFIVYIILWIAVPVANTSTEKLEMRGEKVNLNSIANTVKSDMETASTSIKKSSASSGIGNAIRVLFKAIFIFFFAIAAISLFAIFIGLLFGGIALAPLKGFVFSSGLENIFAWMTLVLVFMLPLVALVTWAIRRLMGVRTKRHSLGYSFIGLWILGLFSAAMLIYMVARNFKRSEILDEEQITIIQPANKLVIDVEPRDWKNGEHEFFGIDVEGDFPLYSRGDDSILLNSVRINMVKSNDSLFHIYKVKGSHGRTKEAAAQTAEKIVFDPIQHDSVIVFPQGFFITRQDKFRNQTVRIIVEVPVGKNVSFSNRIGDYRWSKVSIRDRDDDRWGDWDSNNNMYWARPGKEYTMQQDGRPVVVNK
ncbi:MAG: PspC domain-containing protein [Chitinophagaceae bacterium]|nr:PspC domain-containing protein [Chitinophagaceae bacterium]